MNPPPAQPTPPAQETCARPTDDTNYIRLLELKNVESQTTIYSLQDRCGELKRLLADAVERRDNSQASLVARCARLEKALEEIANGAENHLAARSLPFPPLIHVEGLTGGVEKINAMARAALQGSK